MINNLKTQLLALMIVLSLGGLTGLEPVLHNHDLDLQDQHEDCFSCGWTQISADETSSQTFSIQKSYQESSYHAPDNKPSIFLASSSLSRAPPKFC